MSRDLEQLVDALAVEQLDTHLFRGFTPESRNPRVYGGQVLAQALSAADRSVTGERRVHSLHGYFLRPGDPSRPIIYEVDPIRDGRRFSTCMVTARQGGKAIFSGSVSYQQPEEGLEHQEPMPEVPPPESVQGYHDFYQHMKRAHPEQYQEVNWNPIDYRPLIPIGHHALDKHPPYTGAWMRTNGKLGDDPRLHTQVLTYMSDSFLLATALLPHGVSFDHPSMETASIDHAIWFYGDFRADEWIFFELRSLRSGGARGHNLGVFYTRDGRLVGIAVQEGLMHQRKRGG